MKECQNFQTMIQNYVAGEIPPSELESLREHCSFCSDCRALSIASVHENPAD